MSNSDVINEYQPEVSGKGFAAIARKYSAFLTGTFGGLVRETRGYRSREKKSRAAVESDDEFGLYWAYTLSFL
jgi:hypothetical protein